MLYILSLPAMNFFANAENFRLAELEAMRVTVLFLGKSKAVHIYGTRDLFYERTAEKT